MFEDDDVTHVEGDVNPVRDLGIIFEELRLKDESILELRINDLEKKTVRGNDKKLKPEYVSLEVGQYVTSCRFQDTTQLRIFTYTVFYCIHL